MNRLVSLDTKEPWRRRLYLPAYQIKEAARYADISPKTVVHWHRGGDAASAHLSLREARASLSYLQLIEVAVVAALRHAGVPLKKIRETRDYCAKNLSTEFPFAEYKFKTDGKKIIMDYLQFDKKAGRGKVIVPHEGGQLGWKSILDKKLTEFEYDKRHGLAVKWHVGGKSSRVTIDPLVSFGAPNVNGLPTWVVRGRWTAGESLEDISEDFRLPIEEIKAALKFEGVDDIPEAHKTPWSH